jgi:glycosyltransferase involved in cell wall biosynthesis
MKLFDSVVVFAIYPGLEKYLPAFIASLNKQVDKKFDIIYCNDGYNKLLPIITIEGSVLEHSLAGRQTPAQIRTHLILAAQDTGYENLIFADADDVLHSDRVLLCKNYLITNDLVVNDLDVIDEYGDLVKSSLFGGSKIDFNKVSIFSLLDGNFIGLTNSAFKLRDVADLTLLLSYDVVAFDWLFFSIYLLKPRKVHFVSTAPTSYRVFGKNIVGLGLIDDVKSAINFVLVKKNHYKAMVHYIESFSEEKEVVLSRYVSALSKMNELDQSLVNDEYFKLFKKYSNETIEKSYSGWWSNIKLAKELKRDLLK